MMDSTARIIFERPGQPTTTPRCQRGGTRAIKKAKCERRRKRIGTDTDGKPIYLETIKVAIELWSKTAALRLAAAKRIRGFGPPPRGRCALLFPVPGDTQQHADRDACVEPGHDRTPPASAESLHE
jgi:hypothetical protein